MSSSSRLGSERRCALYVRVSTERQLTEEGSLKSQVQRLREELARRSHDGNIWRETKVYVDEGVSGKDLNRPQFIEMARDVKAGLIDTVICTELSRVSRSVVDFLTFMEFLHTRQVGFVCLKQQFDSTTPHGKVMMTVLVALAQFERELTSERTSENLHARAKRGLRNGSQVLGYDPDPNRRGYLIVNQDEAAVVALIFDKYLELGSVSEVVAFLNEAGYRTKSYIAKSSGRKREPQRFRASTVHYILTNRAYIGEVEINRMNKSKDQAALPERKKYAVTKAVWPPIVDADKYWAVQSLMRQNGQERKNVTARVMHNFVLRGLIECAVCNAPLQDGSGTSKSGRIHFYYRHRSDSRRHDCDLPSLRAEGLEKMILSRLDYLASNHEIIEDIARAANKRLEEEVPKIMGFLGERKREYARLSREIDDWLNKIKDLDNETLKELVVPKVEALKEQREHAAREINSLQKELDDLKNGVVSAIEIQEMLQSFDLLYAELPPHQQRELLGYIIKSIRVAPAEIEMALYARATLERFTRTGGVFAQHPNWLRD